jgi:hypothetical protein
LKFSADGNFLAFGAATNPATFSQIYLADLSLGTNLLISQTYDTHAAVGAYSDSLDISPDGRFVAFRSAAANIVPGDTNGVRDIFLFARQSASTVLLSASRFGPWPANNQSMNPVFSNDGHTLVFQSWASDLVGNDFNNTCDLVSYNVLANNQIPLYVTINPAAAPGQSPVLTWPILPGQSYRVQFKDSLADNQWQDVTGGVTIAGNQAYFNDPGAPASQRFYRVIAY